MYLWCLDCSVHVCPSVTITRQSVQAQIIRYKTGLTEAFKAARLERSVSYWEFKLHLRGQLCSQTLFIITTHIKQDQLDRLFLSVQWTKQTSQYVPITTQISPVKLLYLHVSLLSRVYPASFCCYLFSFLNRSFHSELPVSSFSPHRSPLHQWRAALPATRRACGESRQSPGPRTPPDKVAEVCHSEIKTAPSIQRVPPPGSHYHSRSPCQKAPVDM